MDILTRDMKSDTGKGLRKVFDSNTWTKGDSITLAIHFIGGGTLISALADLPGSMIRKNELENDKGKEVYMKRLFNIVTTGLLMILTLSSAFSATAEERSGLGDLNTGIVSTSNDEQRDADGIDWSVAKDRLPEPESKKEWTFMIYMCASDNLGKGARSDLEEMASAGFDESIINVVVYTGGSTEWGGANIPTDRNTLLSIYSNEVRRIMEHDPIANMSVYDTLTQFINITATLYPAEKYALILWDHGAGPNVGIINDAVFNTGSMDLDSLKSALENSQFKDNPLAIMGFDACLMGNVEVAKAIHPYARYMVASEESEPDYGWNYSFLGDIKADVSADEVATNIVDRYFEYYTQNPEHTNKLKVTLASIDLEQIDPLKASYSTYFKEASDILTEDNYVKFAKARDKSLEFTKELDLIDLGTFVKNLDELSMPSQKMLLDNIDKAVHYNRSMDEDATGLTVYHPYFKGIKYNNIFKSKYANLSLEEEYTHYIDKFTSYLNNQPYVSWSGTSTLESPGNEDEQNESTKDVNTSFTLQLTEEQYEFLAEAQLLVFDRMDENSGYAVVSIIPDVVMDDENHTVAATYVHRALFITNEDGSEILSGPLPYDLIGDDFYSLEVTLVGHDEQGNEIRQPARLEFTLQDKDGTLELAQILLPEEDDFYTIRHSVTLSDFDSMTVKCETRKPLLQTEGDETLLLPYDQWEMVNLDPCDMLLDGSCSLRMLHDQLNYKDIYVGFALRDYQNRHYIRDLQKLVPEKPVPDSLTVGGIDDDYLQLTIPWPVLDTDGSKPGARISFRVKNTSVVEEAIFHIGNIRMNGQPCDLSLDIYGSGANDGMAIGEEQFATLLIPADQLRGLGALTRIDFDVTLLDASKGNSLFETLEDCWVSMEIDVSNF